MGIAADAIAARLPFSLGKVPDGDGARMLFIFVACVLASCSLSAEQH
jgi:hypothetical protein